MLRSSLKGYIDKKDEGLICNNCEGENSKNRGGGGHVGNLASHELWMSNLQKDLNLIAFCFVQHKFRKMLKVKSACTLSILPQKICKRVNSLYVPPPSQISSLYISSPANYQNHLVFSFWAANENYLLVPVDHHLVLRTKTLSN